MNRKPHMRPFRSTLAGKDARHSARPDMVLIRRAKRQGDSSVPHLWVSGTGAQLTKRADSAEILRKLVQRGVGRPLGVENSSGAAWLERGHCGQFWPVRKHFVLSEVHPLESAPKLTEQEENIAVNSFGSPSATQIRTRSWRVQRGLNSLRC